MVDKIYTYFIYLRMYIEMGVREMRDAMQMK